MRPIKFRGKRLDNGEWVYGYVLNSFEGAHIVESDYFKPSNDEHPWLTDVDGKTIGQFIGLLDKNGKEIYDGDVNQDSGVCKWNNDDASFYWDYKCIDAQAMEGENEWCEIIGNIHDKNQQP